MLNNIKDSRKRFIALLTAFAILLTTAAVTLGFYLPDVTATVRSWYTGTANHGVMVRYHNESGNDYNSLYS
ncbi:MAG: hypothetical protein LBQ48_04415 [Oscillospiraceae bacterium]|jgi:hypothetical protein|nr:hypothetical protein [Oscillospiraceae bacterium]